MGYRCYLGKAKKGSILAVPSKHDPAYFEMNKSAITQLFELGKYIEWRDSFATDVLRNEDSELYIISKSFLLFLIEEYRKLNHKHAVNQVKAFKKAVAVINTDNNTLDLTELEKRALVYEFQNLKTKMREWDTDFNCLRLEPSNDGQITSSWLYEYSIFNLVHILHTFDWENDNLLYYVY